MGFLSLYPKHLRTSLYGVCTLASRVGVTLSFHFLDSFVVFVAASAFYNSHLPFKQTSPHSHYFTYMDMAFFASHAIQSTLPDLDQKPLY